MLLKGENISFRYNKGPFILDNVSIAIGAGEVVGLLGPSGCGKTTLGRILAGYQLPEKGRVTVGDKPLPTKGFNPVQLIFQHPERAVNPRWQMHKTLNEGWEPSDELLDELGIEKQWLTRWPNELSGGELQRFCVARALAPPTEFLIADEMTTMLDAITQAQIWHVAMRIVRERNIGMVVISHEAHLINRLCDRIVDFKNINSSNLFLV